MRRLNRFRPVLTLLALALTMAALAAAVGQPGRASADGPGYVTGIVYQDKDMDGERDETDPPLAWQKVELSTYNGDEPRTAISKSDGSYRFDGIQRGVGYQLNLEVDDRILCRTDPGEGGWGLSATDRPFFDGIDFGAVRKGSGRISGVIFNDENENGRRDEGEPPLAGWGVQAGNLDVDRSIYCPVEVTSDADGSFRIDDLPPFAYSFYVWWSSGPEPVRGAYWQPWEVNYVRSSDPTSAAPDDIKYPKVTLSAGEDVGPVEMGVHFPAGTAAITGKIFQDGDRDGVRDEGEPGVVNTPNIWLWRQVDGRLLRIEHLSYRGDADGNFLVVGLPGGTYYLAADYRWQVTSPTNSSGYPYNWVEVAEGELATGVNFGYAAQSSEVPAPETPTPSPPATATPALRAPDTGSGDTGSNDLATFAVGLAALSAGALAGAIALRRRHRGASGGQRP